MIKFCCYSMDNNVSSAQFDTRQFQNPRIQNINRKIIKENKEIEDINNKILKINLQIFKRTILSKILKQKHQIYKLNELKIQKFDLIKLKSQRIHDVNYYVKRRIRLLDFKQSLPLLDNDFLDASAF